MLPIPSRSNGTAIFQQAMATKKNKKTKWGALPEQRAGATALSDDRCSLARVQGNLIQRPRRVRVERGIYRNPSTSGYQIEYSDSTGRVRWQRVPGGLRNARLARAEIQARLGRGQLVGRTRRSFVEVGEEWLAAQTHLRPRTHERIRPPFAATFARRRLGNKPITDVDEDVITRVIAELQAAGLSGWTIQEILPAPGGRS